MELKGSIVTKMVRGRKYYVHQYRDGNTVRNKSLSEEEAYSLVFKLEYLKKYDYEELINHSFNCDIQFGNKLYSLLEKYRGYKHRYCFGEIKKFLNDNQTFGSVLALYGLRRTGKTTLIFQNIIDMDLNSFARTAYIKITNKDEFSKLMKDLDYLTTHGFKCIFIDEVTLLSDFISLASTLSDIYGLRSKIVLSGTDSLGFMITKYEELFDRVYMIHTTYISYKEFSEVLGINSIDKYIEYGGLMTIEGINYNNEKFTVDEYVDSAIAHNIEHSLKYYNDGDHFHVLYPFYEKHELTNVINRIIEDTNHRFAISVIESSFRSHDYGSLKNLILRNNDPSISSSLDEVNEEEIIKLLMDELSIINKEKQINKIDDSVIKSVESYLDLLDLCKEVDVVNAQSFAIEKKKVFIQPGLRFAQAKALLNILMNNKKIMSLPRIIRDFIQEKLLSDIKGRMLEEIVLYQTYVTNKETFKLSFPVGEYDMVVLDTDKKETSIFEIKYSSVVNERQYQYLNNEEYNYLVDRAYYPI